jgi:PAS domain S-box-containing protein
VQFHSDGTVEVPYGSCFGTPITRRVVRHSAVSQCRRCQSNWHRGRKFGGAAPFFNPAFCSFLGFTEEELRSKHCVDFSPAEDAKKDWNLFQQLRAGEKDRYQLEKRYFRKDGSLVWGRLSLSLLRSDPVPLVIALVEDITDKRTAEEALRISEGRLRLAQQAARMGTFEWNIQNGVNTWTPELETLYGLPAGGFGGTQSDFENRLHPEDREIVAKLIEHSFLTGEPARGEWRIVWPDASVHWIDSRWQVLRNENGKPVRMLGVNVDATERKLAEQALVKANRTLEKQASMLQSREELLKIFVKNVPAGVAMLDREMRYIQVSDRWCADYSIDSSQVLGRSHYEVFPDCPQRWKEAHRRGLAGETLRVDEDRWDREGGKTTWVRWEIRPWTRPRGNIGGILIFAEDISERKQMQEALSNVSRRLIEAQEEERARIARELHDDVSQQLALLAVEFDQWDQSGAVSTNFRDHLEQAKRRILEICKDVQALSHELHSSKLEYLGLARAARSLCREISEKNDIQIDFTDDGHARTLPNEVSLSLFRILQESLHNAVEHSGVKHVEVQLWEQLEAVHLKVKDSGRGFDVEAAKQSKGLGLTSMYELS